MRERLALLWESLHRAYWFYPTLLSLAGATMAFVLTALDRRLGEEVQAMTLIGLYSGGAAGARAMLGAIATAVLGVAGTTFSVTVAILSLTTSQFGPRLLRNFLRDAGNQVVLGVFVATFLYCLLVMRTVRNVEETSFVPHVAITFGVSLAVVCVAMLVYFIHHIVSMIQAPNFIALSSGELMQSIDRLYPKQLGPQADEPAPSKLAGISQPLNARRVGYLQAYDRERLVALARDAGGVIELLRAPGDFLVPGAPLARLHAQDCDIDEAGARLDEAMSLGSQPTPLQDITMPVNQLTEIGMRALSSSVNDPNTAMTCIAHLSAALCALAARPFPSPCRNDDQGDLRIVAMAPTFEDILHLAMDPFRRYGAHDARVLTGLLDALDDIGASTAAGPRRAALQRLADEILDAGRRSLASSADRVRLSNRYAALRRSLRGGEPDRRLRPARPEGAEEESA